MKKQDLWYKKLVENLGRKSFIYWETPRNYLKIIHKKYKRYEWRKKIMLGD